MSRIDEIKRKYDACEMTYEDALAYLEAFGMWASDADDLLVPPKRCDHDGTLLSECKGVACQSHQRCCWQ